MKDLKDYQIRAHQSIDKLFKEIEDLSKMGMELKEEQQKRFRERMLELTKKKEEVQKKYSELLKASGFASEAMKKGFEKANEELTEAWKKARAEFEKERV